MKVKNESACALLENGSGARIGNCVLIHTIPSPTASGIWLPMYAARELCSSRVDSTPNPTMMNAQPT